MNKAEYQATFTADIGTLSTEVGRLINEINNQIHHFGYDEKLKATTRVFTLTVSVDHELTEKEQYKMRRILEAQVITAMPQYDIRLESFSRKSGNVLQSAS